MTTASRFRQALTVSVALALAFLTFARNGLAQG